jgi:hypothetical protein
MSRDIGPEWSCLHSYINLLHYCQTLMVSSIFPKPHYRQLVTQQLAKTLSSLPLTLRNLYDFLNLAYQESLSRYLTFMLGDNLDHHALPNHILLKAKPYLL